MSVKPGFLDPAVGAPAGRVLTRRGADGPAGAWFTEFRAPRNSCWRKPWRGATSPAVPPAVADELRSGGSFDPGETKLRIDSRDLSSRP